MEYAEPALYLDVLHALKISKTNALNVLIRQLYFSMDPASVHLNS